ncbi:MAG: anhydro-N-acetylmuramic acid kinase [Actinomycetota bacterium]
MVRVIGLISGTSVDGIDAALVEITGYQSDLKVERLAGSTYPYPDGLRSQILAVAAGEPLSMAELATLDDAIAQVFAQAALTIQEKFSNADLIGSHGQTVYHRPPQKQIPSRLDDPQQVREHAESRIQPATCITPNHLGYSIQLGRGAAIAYLTGIPTVSNFRAADIAMGGQGAPLVPIVDACLLSHPTYHRCIQNLGGIGNVTYLPPQAVRELGKNAANFPASEAATLNQGVIGWDTGPGNALLDLAVQHFSGGIQTYDQDGAWAARGTLCQSLVERWLQQDFFQQQPPKSTGRELFGSEYLHQCLVEAETEQLSPADVLATLTELTAASVVHSYRNFLPQMPDQVLLCGGGSRNLYLKQRLQALLAPTQVLTTTEAGLDADFKEAIAFAVLAYWRMQGIPGNLPQVTGAASTVLLGEIHHPGRSWA